jgi:hypothetical protein
MSAPLLLERIETLIAECSAPEHLSTKIVLTSLAAALHDDTIGDLARHVVEFERDQLRRLNEQRMAELGHVPVEDDEPQRELTTIEMAKAIFDLHSRHGSASSSVFKS